VSGKTTGAPPLLDLFRGEVETNTAVLSDGLLALERGAGAQAIEPLMRAAHSVKGAARIVGVECATSLAHAMEDCLVAAQGGRVTLDAAAIDLLLRATVTLAQIGRAAESNAAVAAWEAGHRDTLGATIATLKGVTAGQPAPAPPPRAAAPAAAPAEAEPPAARPAPGTAARDRVVRVTATDIDRLMGFASESLIESRQLHAFVDSLRGILQKQDRLAKALDDLGNAVRTGAPQDEIAAQLADCRTYADECHQSLSDRSVDCDGHARRLDDSSSRLYREVVASRMRPFSDVLSGFPRMIRDLARSLGKRVRLEVVGESTKVDRDILDRLEAPLNHILRNAVDHAMETPAERVAAGKPDEGCIRVDARHRAGMLLITISDDGRGIDTERIRRKSVERGLVAGDLAARLTPAELLDFIFLPGLSTAESVTEISGRGVGLDVVQTTMQEFGGSVRVFTELGRGTRFTLQLPITLSVIRAVVVSIAGEPYAFPLTRIERIARVNRRDVQMLEGRPYFSFEDHHVGLLEAHEVLELDGQGLAADELPVLVLSDRSFRYGLVVERFMGEQDLVVRRLDPRLGKVSDIAAAAIMNDGSPLLIIDVDDMLRSIEKRLQAQGFGQLAAAPAAPTPSTAPRKRVLVVDDSITVREVERQLLANRGYEVATAVDGVDGWNSLRNGVFDLVISDVDMPRMNGIELVRNIRQDVKLRSLPVVIVSYKDREEDRMRGLEAGANSYLTKSSFHDDTLIQTVEDLIGASQS